MPKASRGAKEQKRRVVARGVVAGKSTRAIAAEAGCNPRHVRHLAAEPETEFLIREIMRPYYDRLAKMAKSALIAVDGALKAEIGRGRFKRPDHEIRLRAIGRFRTLAEMAQGKPSLEAEGPTGLVTWEEFVVLYRKRTEHGDGSTVIDAPVG